MENKIEKLALFGGSFDPVTNAHRDIIEKLSERFDEVVVMPTAVSPFKTKNSASASGDRRVDMLKRACRDFKNVTISRYELKREGVSYTVDTVEHLKDKYDADVTTVIGSEELPYLNKWKDCARLKELTTFYVIERKGYPADKAAKKAIDRGYRVRIAPFGVGSESSSEVKLARAFGREKLPVPKAVAKYIEKNGLYEDYRFITERYDEFGLRRERVEHTERVAYSAIALAKAYGVSAHDALVAALLHDIAKETDEKWFERNGLSAPDTSGMPKKIRHALYGAAIAKSCFGIDDEEILDAIRLHTTGGDDMSELAEVIFLADYIEEGRNFDGVEKIRLAARESLKKGMCAALERTLAFLEEDGGEIYVGTLTAYEHYKNLCSKGKKAAKKTAEAVPEKSVKKTDKPVKAKVDSKPEAEKESAVKEESAKAEREKHAPAKKESAERADVAAPSENAPAATVKQSEENSPDHEKAHALAREIGGWLCEKKGREVMLIDVSERTIITDYFVIATANSTTQVRSLADYVDEKMSKGKGIEPLHRDNNPQWYVVDYGNVIVHVFLKSVREVYSLERLWSDGNNEELLDD